MVWEHVRTTTKDQFKCLCSKIRLYTNFKSKFLGALVLANVRRSIMTKNISNSTSHSNYDKIMAHLPASDCISWLAVLIPKCLAIVILNIVTIIIFLKQHQLQRRSTYLIIHLVLVDLLVGAVSGPLQITNRFSRYCDLWNFN